MPAIVDTSVLIAVMRAKETDHARSVAALVSHAHDDVYLPTTILAETLGLAKARWGVATQRRMWGAIHRLGVRTFAVDETVLRQAAGIDECYADAGFGFADATLLACCEELRVGRILSLDRRLAIYRPSFAGALEIIP